MIKKYNIWDYLQGEYPFSWNRNCSLDIAMQNKGYWWHYQSLLENWTIINDNNISDIVKHIDFLFDDNYYFQYLLSNPAITIEQIELYLPIDKIDYYYKDNKYNKALNIYVSSILQNPNIKLSDIKKYSKYSNLKNHISDLLLNKFCYHEYYKSNIYKKRLVENFIYYYGSEIRLNYKL